MSAVAADTPDDGPGRWVPAGAGSGPRCPGGHGPGGGSLDESARRLSHEELAAARLLAAEGHEVRSLPESRIGGRRADLEACGRPVEVKSYLPAPERDGRAPSPRSVFNKLVDGAGQADSVVIVGYGSGLTESTARRGMARYATDPKAPPLGTVRVVGDGFDLAWVRRPELGPRPAPERRPPGPGPSLDL